MNYRLINLWCICLFDFIVESLLNVDTVRRTAKIHSLFDGLGRVLQSRKREIPLLNRLKGAGDTDHDVLNKIYLERAVEQNTCSFLGTSVLETDNLSALDEKNPEHWNAILQHRMHELLYGSTNSQGVGVDYLGHIACVDDGYGNNAPESPVAPTTNGECLQSQQIDRLADRLLTTMERWVGCARILPFTYPSFITAKPSPCGLSVPE